MSYYQLTSPMVSSTSTARSSKVDNVINCCYGSDEVLPHFRVWFPSVLIHLCKLEKKRGRIFITKLLDECGTGCIEQCIKNTTATISFNFTKEAE